jgi:hypothetical protein
MFALSEIVTSQLDDPARLQAIWPEVTERPGFDK